MFIFTLHGITELIYSAVINLIWIIYMLILTAVQLHNAAPHEFVVAFKITSVTIIAYYSAVSLLPGRHRDKMNGSQAQHGFERTRC